MKVTHPFSSEETFSSGVFSVKPVFFDLELNSLEKLKWYLWGGKKKNNQPVNLQYNDSLQFYRIFCYKCSKLVKYSLRMVFTQIKVFIQFELVMVVTSL